MAKILWLILFFARFAFAQETDAPGGFHFQPPRPPPMDSNVEMDEPDDEEPMEIGDEPLRPGQLPPAPGALGAPPEFRPPGTAAPVNFGGSGGYGASASNSDGKIRFQVVEGEFWQKGKKRERGNRRSR